jgi:succinyl-diaminopimelate desuccinylase
MAPAAPPSLEHPLLAGLLQRAGHPPTGKLGWTDVGRFASRGVPAANFGPGDPKLAHHKDERVERGELDRAYAVLRSLVTEGVQEQA